VKNFGIVLLLALVSGCAGLDFMTEKTVPVQKTLADLPVAPLAPRLDPPQPLSHLQLVQAYRDVLEVSIDPVSRARIQRRLADLQMMRSEEKLIEEHAGPEVFGVAIEAYESLLQENSDWAGNDQLLYQLSKAYDLGGESEKSIEVLEQLSARHPDSQHYPEAEFRLAERYFVESNYPAAELAYGRVIDLGEATPYYLQAQYMLGWSRFKRGQFRGSIAPFSATLDLLIPAGGRTDELSRAQRELRDDCFRVLAVIFSSLQGAETIAAAYEELGERPYQHDLYQALGAHYLAQQRYRDSAEAFRAFTRLYPTSPRTPQFALRVVQAYEAGGFPELIIAEKQAYVTSFALSGDYWSDSAVEVRAEISATLKLFISELASYHHALARAAAAEKGQTELAALNFDQASRYYQLFIDSFPLDEDTADMGFLLAESRFEAGDYSAAIPAFERVAYDLINYERSADAGYMAIVAYGRLAPGDPQSAEQGIGSELRFAATFPRDQRAVAVLDRAATALLAGGQYQLAIIAAATLAAWDTTEVFDISSRLVMADSHFKLQQFQLAEQSYQSAVNFMPSGDKRRAEALEQVAASIYKQGEIAAKENNYRGAAQQFARVLQTAPRSDAAIAAHYDAAANYMLAGELLEANRLLLSFRRNYPGHSLTESVASRLVDNYVQLQQWALAAAELDGIYRREENSEQRGQLLYLTAQYYDKAGDWARAIDRYRLYAHEDRYSFELRLEAMSRLSELYGSSGEVDKRRFWLRRMLATHDTAGDWASERSLYLAALSASELADDKYRAFTAVKLQLPLKKSLGRKKVAMNAALAAYQKTGDYGVSQFSNLASYRVGLIYQGMGNDLLASQRPTNLDPLALEQYELLLEEQAYPFEEKAIDIWESNARRARQGEYDEWIQASFSALADVLPARYRKAEDIVDSNLELAVYNQQAISLRERGRFNEAEQLYLAALNVWELHPDSHRNLGILYDLYMGYPDRALQHFSRYQVLTGAGDTAVAGWIADLERQSALVAQGD
jgi:tetratricopeptide (TPR) repeat protein